MEGWTDFYVAEVGAAAALAGLLVVAISINIERILDYPSLPGRAAQMVSGALVVASLGLLPGQPHLYFGWEALSVGLVVAATAVREMAVTLRIRKPEDPIGWVIIPFATAAVAFLPNLIGGYLLIAGDDRGLYWVAIGVILSFLATLQNGWVLLVEILR